MAENEKSETPEAGIPPKLNLKEAVTPPPAPPAPGTAKKATTRIDMAAAAMISEEKSKTTRINLGTFGAEGGVPKTIKIQRPSEASTIKLNRAPGAPPPAPAPAAPAAPPLAPAQAKRQTSRIPLTEALITPAEGAAATPPAETAPQPAGPKTIRIKRPSDMSTPAPSAAPASPAPAPEAAAEPATEAGPPTQRKTIKLRRPGGGDIESGRPSVTLPKSAAEFAESQAAGEQAEDEPGGGFAVLSLVATLVAAVLVYMLLVQAMPDLNLSWF